MVLLLVSAAVPLMLREVEAFESTNPTVPLMPLVPSHARKVMASVMLPL